MKRFAVGISILLLRELRYSLKFVCVIQSDHTTHVQSSNPQVEQGKEKTIQRAELQYHSITVTEIVQIKMSCKDHNEIGWKIRTTPYLTWESFSSPNKVGKKLFLNLMVRAFKLLCTILTGSVRSLLNHVVSWWWRKRQNGADVVSNLVVVVDWRIVWGGWLCKFYWRWK